MDFGRCASHIEAIMADSGWPQNGLELLSVALLVAMRPS